MKICNQTQSGDNSHAYPNIIKHPEIQKMMYMFCIVIKRTKSEIHEGWNFKLPSSSMLEAVFKTNLKL